VIREIVDCRLLLLGGEMMIARCMHCEEKYILVSCAKIIEFQT
jgi:hypothetical protein